jgi:hypothetical protein
MNPEYRFPAPAPFFPSFAGLNTALIAMQKDLLGKCNIHALCSTVLDKYPSVQ